MAEKTMPQCGVLLHGFPKENEPVCNSEVCDKCEIHSVLKTFAGNDEKSLLRELVEKEIGETTDNEILSVVPEATQKLIWIISREGTANGKRLTAEYYAKLIAERIIAYRFIEKRKKKHAAKANMPQTLFTILSQSCQKINKEFEKNVRILQNNTTSPEMPFSGQASDGYQL